MTEDLVDYIVDLFNKATLTLKTLLKILGIEIHYKTILKIYTENT